MTQLQVNERRYIPGIVVFVWAIVSFMGCVSFLISFERSVLPIFATDRLLLVHIFAAFPISYLLLLRSKVFWNRLPLSLVVLVLLSATLLAVLVPLSDVLKTLGAGFLTRWIIRSSISICFSSVLLIPIVITCRKYVVKNWIWAFMVWLVLPCVYGLKQSERSLGDFIASSSSVQTVKTWQSLSRLVEISGHTTALGQSTIQWERSLRRQIRDAESLVAKPLSEDATMHDKLQQAMMLLTLSRTTEAISLLGDVDTLDSQVQLIGAIASRELEDWASVESFCRSIIGAQSQTPGDQDPMPYQLLGESLIHQRKVKEAEKCFREAIVACPLTAGDFEIRLGSLLGESGDHAGAIAHFEAAQKSEPALRSEATRRIASMLNNSCRISSH